MADLAEGDVTSARAAIAGRYLGVKDGERFAAERRSSPGVLLGWSPTVRGSGTCRHPAVLIGLRQHRPTGCALWTGHQTQYLSPCLTSAQRACLPCLIIQAIRQDPSGSTRLPT